MHLRYLSLIYIITVCIFDGYTQNTTQIGVPFIEHYNMKEMGFNNKTWDITQNAQHELYFANGNNILQYDGERWDKIYQTENYKSSRSLRAFTNDSIFIGIDGDYGVLEREANGDFNFSSLFSFNSNEAEESEEFWKIHEYKNYYVFQTFRSLYIYDGELTTKIPAPFRFKWSNKVDNDFYVIDTKYGVFRFSGNNLLPVVSDSQLNDKILGVTEVGGKRLVVTSNQGLYFIKNRELIKWDFPNANTINEAQIFSFLPLKNGDLAIGTVSNGLYIIDENGNFKTHLNKRKGLQNNTILTLFEDHEFNLWLGLDFGIDYVKLNSNLTYRFDFLGDFGSTYAAQLLDDELYLGTNQGLYHVTNAFGTNSTITRNNFESLLSGQVWNLDRFDNLLFVGHDRGAYTFDGKNLKQIGEEPGAWNFRKVNETYMVSGNYDGISIYKKENNQWKFRTVLKDYKGSGRFIEVDENDNLWVSLNADGAFQFQVDFETGEIINQTFYDIKDLNMLEIFVSKIEDKIVLVGSGKIYNYDKASQSFVDHSLQGKIPSFTNKVVHLNDQNWFLSNAKAGVSVNGHLELLPEIYDRLIYDVLTVFPLNETQTLIPIYNGFSIYTEGQEKKSDIDVAVSISSLSSFDNVNRYPNEATIKYSDNDFVIRYAQPNFGKAVLYQTRLNTEEWSNWSPRASTTIRNLKEGTYTFQVKAKINEKVTEDEIVFTIEPPIYRTTVAYIIYVILLGLLISALVFWNQYRLKKQEQKLLEKRRISLEQQEQRFELEQREQQKRIVELENEKLQEEVQNKSRELTQIAHVNMNKNKILKKIKDKLKEVQEKSAEKLSYSGYNELKRYVEYYITDKENELFTINFDKSHQDFYTKLSEKYPTLTPKDLRLCAYLKINLSSKEIAPLLGISPQSVDVSRHRLRKKMNLNSKDNLTAVLAAMG